MDRMVRDRGSLKAVFACALLALTLPGFAAAQSTMFIFGDSLSDAGNVFNLVGINASAPYEPIPAAPYDLRGGDRFTNGKTWVEQLAGELGIGASASAVLQGPGPAANYAFGGARARAAGDVPSSAQQLGLFFARHGSVVPPDGLYVLQFGGNDVRDALLDPANAVTIVVAAAQAVIGDIQALYAAGAREFLVANSPNLGRAPAVAALGASVPAAQLSGLYNFVLEAGLSQMDALPGIRIERLDLFGLIEDVIAFPESYGLTDPFTPCLSFYVLEDAVCHDAAKRLFWDGIHPTTAGHSVLAEEALRVLTD